MGAVPGGQILKRLFRIADHQQILKETPARGESILFGIKNLFIDEGARGPLSKGLFQVDVPILPCPFQGNKKVSRGKGPGIDRGAGRLDGGIGEVQGDAELAACLKKRKHGFFFADIPGRPGDRQKEFFFPRVSDNPHAPCRGQTPHPPARPVK